MNRQDDSSSAQGVKSRSRIAQPHLAVLLTDHPPAGGVILVPAQEPTAGEATTKYRFTPLHHYADRQALLGLILTSAGERLPSFHGTLVQRGRRGGKQPEQLYIAGKAPDSLRSGIGPLTTGLLKALGRAQRDAAGTNETGLLHWWLAVEFIRRGYIPHSKATARTEGAGMAAYDPPERVMAAGGWLIWREYLERCVDEILVTLQTGKRNPLLNQVTHRMVRSKFRLPDDELAGQVLEQLAHQAALPLTQTDAGPLVVLTGDLAPPDTNAVDARAVEAVLKLLADGRAAGYAGLLKAAPSQPHVVAWLFEADKLIESPDGYVFTADELNGYLKQLSADGMTPIQASIRDIKDRLRLARRAAEGLRAWLVAAYA